MAINRATLDAAQRIQIFATVPVPMSLGLGLQNPVFTELNYDRVKIDGVDFWETIGPMTSVSPKGTLPRGIVVGAEFCQGNGTIWPSVQPGDLTANTRGVWQLGAV